MQLIGMLDSPFVRRAALSLRVLAVPFEHRPISVFRTFEQFSEINPVVKAPTLVCDDGTVLMDSSLIIDYAECLAGRSLLPVDRDARRKALRVVGLGLAACEKAVQLVYENLRPTEKQDEAWSARVRLQLGAALAALETELKNAPLNADERALDQPGIITAVAWRFIQLVTPNAVSARDFPRLVAWSTAAETLPVFRALPPV
jgi:glutathione S-transferase